MLKDQYFFGRTLAKEIDFFAFPRSGSHFFRYCTQGLFDLVALRMPGTNNAEAISRQGEVDPLALYALDLREDGAAHAPVIFHTRATGQHGLPAKREHPSIVLIRDPAATVYSYYRAARDRWGMLAEVRDHGAWIRAKFLAWHEFYAAARAMQESHREEVLVIRYESLRKGPGELERVVEFIGTAPKLSPAFVHEILRFERFVRPGARTFYVAGDDAAWRSDADFAPHVVSLDMPDTTALGYPHPAEAMERLA